MNDNTIKFVVPEDSSEEMKTILTAVYGALSEKGYTPSTRSSVISCLRTPLTSQITTMPAA